MKKVNVHTKNVLWSVHVSAIIDDLNLIPSDRYSIKDILPIEYENALEGIPVVTFVTTENFENDACILYVRNGQYKIIERLQTGTMLL